MRHSAIPVFWICAFLSAAGQYVFVQTTDICHALQRQPVDNKLMYIRMFTDLQQAIGHKLFLEGLSLETLCANIRTINPRMIDLRPISEVFIKNSLH